MNETLEKMKAVIDAIAECRSILIAFSGGVDSSVLACLARQSGASVLAVTADVRSLVISGGWYEGKWGSGWTRGRRGLGAAPVYFKYYGNISNIVRRLQL